MFLFMFLFLALSLFLFLCCVVLLSSPYIASADMYRTGQDKYSNDAPL